MTESTYHISRNVLIAYLRQKVEEADWHGVSDAANDIRVLEALWQGLNKNAKR